MKTEIKSNAKINIGLNIVGRLENGYHLLDMTMIPIDLCDKITIEVFNKKGTLKIRTNKFDIPTGKENILFKIYEAFYDKIGKDSLEVELFLEKNIPHQAGLGGGSSNGASLLKFLNEHHGNPLNLNDMIELGKKIGADIPFFIINKSCRVTGIGENLETIENNLNVSIVLIKPKFGVSTAQAYSNVKKIENPKMADIDKILLGLKTSDLKLVEENIENNLEEGLLLSDENIKKFKERLYSIEDINFYMSGSGSAYYGFLLKDNLHMFSTIQKRFKDCEVYLCNFK
nr:4-(cytidine 5'-diphospho)-2-C-methyl-D-erythritol kinase [uncultured Cetobacterium sp.]